MRRVALLAQDAGLVFVRSRRRRFSLLSASMLSERVVALLPLAQ
jgi:hypothetical protein